MKKYVDEKGHILFLSPSVGVDIPDEEAKEIMELVTNRPVSDVPYTMYRLSDATREWDLVEVLLPVDEDPELSDSEALALIVGGDANA